ncbi:MAG: T9SS type A sorting domain-containing protein [candidate division Zixibacteria bacterium]|nr:T9SS type A sorting domain-containing protein [candidate division Zixibacteria bacterium]
MKTLLSTIGLLIITSLSYAQDAGDIIWEFQGPEDHCVCVSSFSDVDGDGYPDVVGIWGNSAYQGDHNLFCLSGPGDNGVPEVLWSAGPQGGASSSGGYGDQCLARYDDIDGDDIDEIILGTAWGGRCAFLINGVNGETRWVYDTYDNPPSGWCYSVEMIGDLDNDQLPDILAGFGSDADAAVALSGNSGSVIWSFGANDAVFSVSSIRTINYDPYPEAIIGCGDLYDDRVVCVNGGSSGNGDVIWEFSTEESVWDVEGFVDVDNDGLQDILAGSWSELVYCLSATDGDEIWSQSVNENVMEVKSGGDQDGDGIPEVLVASWANAVFSLDGATGMIYWVTPVGTHQGGDVWTLDNCPDVNGDGIDDVIAGSFDENVYMMSGSDGEILWQRPVGNRLKSVRAAGDLNGDGKCDVIAGTQYLYSGGGGRMFAISGGTATSIDDPKPSRPVEFSLHGNYPNPFNSSTNINFTLTYGGKVNLSIYNLAGQEVTVLHDGFLPEGVHSIRWNANDMPSGVYYVNLNHRGKTLTGKMTLVK